MFVYGRSLPEQLQAAKERERETTYIDMVMEREERIYIKQNKKIKYFSMSESYSTP